MEIYLDRDTYISDCALRELEKIIMWLAGTSAKQTLKWRRLVGDCRANAWPIFPEWADAEHGCERLRAAVVAAATRFVAEAPKDLHVDLAPRQKLSFRLMINNDGLVPGNITVTFKGRRYKTRADSHTFIVTAADVRAAAAAPAPRRPAPLTLADLPGVMGVPRAPPLAPPPANPPGEAASSDDEREGGQVFGRESPEREPPLSELDLWGERLPSPPDHQPALMANSVAGALGMAAPPKTPAPPPRVSRPLTFNPTKATPELVLAVMPGLEEHRRANGGREPWRTEMPRREVEPRSASPTAAADPDSPQNPHPIQNGVVTGKRKPGPTAPNGRLSVKRRKQSDGPF